jgi:putative sigma-54 modulation protein
MRMKLQMQSVHFDADKNLLAFIQKKADKLDTFYDHIIDGEVLLKVAKDEAKENKLVEMKIRIPGNTVFAKMQAATFEEATDLAVAAMRNQLQKKKAKNRSK